MAPPAWPEVEAIIAASDIAPAIRFGAEGLLRSDAGFAAFGDHEQVLRRADASERLAFYAVSRLLGRASFDDRRRLLDQLPQPTSPVAELEVDRRAGLLLTDQSHWAPVTAAVEEAKAAFSAPRTDPAPANPGKRFMTTARLPGEALDSKIAALGRHPAVLGLVGRYLEGAPILYRINLLESANDALQDNSSQFFHIDPEDFRQLKIFMLVSDVDEDSGPLHALSADASDEVRIAHRHRLTRLADEEVMGLAPAQALLRCTGPGGTLAIVDTSRCFHFGSRPGKSKRHVVMYQYITPFACAFPIDADAASSKYSDALRRRIAEAGQPASELDARLFGLVR